ncbi:response regulator [Halomonas denitrificans]|nr:response regulator [Halomonas denitrificans]
MSDIDPDSVTAADHGAECVQRPHPGAGHGNVFDLREGRAAHRERVLFVDDSRLVRFAASRGLSPRFEVELADDGVVAWQALHATPGIKAVITDINMPRLDGVGLIERIRASSVDAIRDLPILVVTSVEEAVDRQRALEAGANDLVPKPFTDRDLADPIGRYLAADRPATELARGATDHGNVERRRPGLLLRAEQALMLHARHGLPLSLVHVRLLNHARIAGRWGNAWAEATMRHVERLLADRVRVEDTVGRSAPDTFTLILPATPESGAEQLRKRLDRALRQSPARFPSGSVGLELRTQVQLPGEVRDAERLLAIGMVRLDAPKVAQLSERRTGPATIASTPSR